MRFTQTENLRKKSTKKIMNKPQRRRNDKDIQLIFFLRNQNVPIKYHQFINL